MQSLAQRSPAGALARLRQMPAADQGILLALLTPAELSDILWKGSIGLAAALAIAIVGNLLVAALTGAGAPLALRRLGIDPVA